jgi:phosphatidate cytidylyltransferase
MFLEAAIAYKTERQISINLVFAAIFGAVIMPHMLSFLVDIRFNWMGRYLLLVPIICAFVTDAGAYFSGYLFGKRKAFPRISPNKTVAGCVGGLITGALTLVLFGAIINFATQYHADFFPLAVIGIVGAAFTQLGDLSFSLIKREYNVKDFGKLIPGHGGMLDRFDSLFFAAPAIYFMLYALPSVF